MRIKESMRYSHIQMVFLTLSSTLFTGIFLSDYLVKIGFDEYDFGLLYSINYLAGFIALPVSIYANKVVKKRRFYLINITIAIGFYFVFMIAPHVAGLSEDAIVWISIVTIGGATIATGIAGIVFFPWLYQAAGASSWSRFFTARLVISFITSILCTLLFGLFLNRGGLKLSTLLFVIGFIAGLLQILFTRFIPEYREEETKEMELENWKTVTYGMLKDKGYIGLLFHTALFGVGLGLFTPLVYPYLISEMNIGSSRVSLFQTLMMIMSVFSLLYADKLTDRIGNLKVLLRVSSILWSIPFILLLVPYSREWMSYLVFAFGISEGTGLILIIMFTSFVNLTLAYTPARNKTIYLSAIGFIKAIFLSIGSYIGGTVARGRVSITLLGVEATGYQVAFMGAMVFAFAAYLVLLYIKPLLFSKLPYEGK